MDQMTRVVPDVGLIDGMQVERARLTTITISVREPMASSIQSWIQTTVINHDAKYGADLSQRLSSPVLCQLVQVRLCFHPPHLSQPTLSPCPHRSHAAVHVLPHTLAAKHLNHRHRLRQNPQSPRLLRQARHRLLRAVSCFSLRW